jgi:hypothetical protein
MNERDEYIRFLMALRADYSRYHDHKESSAWAATGVYLAAAASIVYLRRLPLRIGSGTDAAVVAGIVCVFFVLGAVLILWQLSKRTTAAIIVEATQRLISENVYSQQTPTTAELRPDQIRGGGTLPSIVCCEIRRVRESWQGSIGSAAVATAVLVAGVLAVMTLAVWAIRWV